MMVRNEYVPKRTKYVPWYATNRPKRCVPTHTRGLYSPWGGTRLVGVRFGDRMGGDEGQAIHDFLSFFNENLRADHREGLLFSIPKNGWSVSLKISTQTFSEFQNFFTPFTSWETATLKEEQR